MSLLPILIGSRSDTKFLEEGLNFLREKGVVHCVYILSVHREPNTAVSEIKKVLKRNSEAVIVGAATGLPGVVAGYFQNKDIPIFGVRFSASHGPAIIEDATFNLSAMPKGVPLAYCGYNEKGFLHACMMAAKLVEI